MRISTQQVFLSNIDNLNKTSADLFQTQQQLATGKRVLQPSDDPLASAQIQKFKKEIARTDQFIGNIEVSERRLELEEITINQVNDLSIRLRELTLQGKNGTLTQTDRNVIAAEVGEIIKSLDSLMNTKDVQGEYLFSGHKGFTQPYTLDPSSGRYVFNGDDGQRFLQVGPENKIASTDSGFEVFEKVAPVPGYVVADLEQSTTVVTSVDIQGGDAEAFGSYMASNAPLSITVTGGNLEITDKNGAYVTPDDPAVVMDGTYALPVGISTVTIAGVDVEINSSVAGTATLDVFDQHNILNTALDLKSALEDSNFSTSEGKEQFQQRMDHILQNLAGVEEKNIASRSSIGGRLNALEQQSLVNEDYKLFTQEALSSFEDLDYNEAISRFALQETALQASYASFAKVQDLSLFNYIN